jgi:hypothetical protein
MSELGPNPFNLLLEQIRAVVRDEIKATSNGHAALLTPEQLALQLSLPMTWVYEQSRQGNIPTHRIGRYLRFDLRRF